jgi:hypothetical protein
MATILSGYTIAGLVGTTIILVAYFANQQRWLRSEDWRFPAANLLGSMLIRCSSNGTRRRW